MYHIHTVGDIMLSNMKKRIMHFKIETSIIYGWGYNVIKNEKKNNAF